MKKIIVLFTLLFVFSQCQLVDVLDHEPMYKLDLEGSITNPEMAELALIGTYSWLPSSHGMVHMFTTINGSFHSGSMLRQKYVDVIQIIYMSERYANILSYSSFGEPEYNGAYQIIKNMNYLLKALENIPESQFEAGRKNTMIGEAHFLTAFAYYRLMRQFCEYWDMESKYGFVIRDQIPTVAGADKARATVAESYEEIFRHLDIALAQAPDYTTSTRASKQAALALKAQVLFLQGKWADAATAADAAITATNPLEASYGTVFTNTQSSKEVIFCRGLGTTDIADITYMTNLAYNTGHWGPSDTYMGVIGDDPRKEHVVWNKDVVYKNVTYNINTLRKGYKASGAVNVIFARTAEMHLIKAEGLARSGASIADAWAPVVKLRNRAGNTDIAAPATREELMNELFREWWIELAFENWQDWFTVQRFDHEENPGKFVRLLQLNESMKKQMEDAEAAGESAVRNLYNTLERARIYNIPAGERNSNKLCEINPGYTS